MFACRRQTVDRTCPSRTETLSDLVSEWKRMGAEIYVPHRSPDEIMEIWEISDMNVKRKAVGPALGVVDLVGSRAGSGLGCGLCG